MSQLQVFLFFQEPDSKCKQNSECCNPTLTREIAQCDSRKCRAIAFKMTNLAQKTRNAALLIATVGGRPSRRKRGRPSRRKRGQPSRRQKRQGG
jgi:hypothetical protein